MRLKLFLDQKQLSLSDLIAPGATSGTDGDNNVADRLTTAYFALTNGQTNVRVRIADLRRYLASISRAAFDQALLDMASSGKAALYRLDNPAEIHQEDRDAVLRTPAGEERHVVYLGGSGS
jgi:flavin-dependent dehydrogenase